MQKQYRCLCQALLLAVCLVISMSAALYAADKEPATEPGLIIVSVDPDGPAAKAGLVRGDILLVVNEVKVNAVADLVAALRKVKAGAIVTLQVQHGDKTVEHKVTTGNQQQRAYLGLQPYAGAGLLRSAPEQFSLPAEPGIMLPPQWFGFSSGASVAMNQLVVLDVVDGSAAAAAGIQVNDVITSLNGEMGLTLPALQEQLAALAPGDMVTLTVIRADAEPTDIAVILGKGQDGQAQIGVQLGMVSSFDAAQGMAQPPTFLPVPPLIGTPFQFWQEEPWQQGRRFFHFGRPLAPPMYFFVMPYPDWPSPDFLSYDAMPYPGWSPKDFRNSEGTFVMPIPAQPGQWFSAPPVSVEIQGEIKPGAPAEQDPASYY